MEFELSPTPPKADYRSYDTVSDDNKMYAVMLNETYTNSSIVIKDNETAVAVGELKLLGDSSLSLLGSARLFIL